MNEHEKAKKITGYLDSGTAAMRAGTAYKLQLARQQALARLGAQPEHAPELTLAGVGGVRIRRSGPVSTRAPIWVGIITLTAGLLFYQHWQTVQQTREVEETDAALLTSELPIEAYLDRGFQRWLTHSEP
jgi:hypothetical protein